MNQNLLHRLSSKDGLEASSLLRTLIDALPEQVYVKDTEGRYILNNLAHVRALGAASPEEIAGKSDSDFYPEELVESYRADEQEVLRSGQPLIDKEEPSVDGEGNERWHSTTKVPLRDGDGEIVGLVGTTRDVTDRKEAEEALKESEERFRGAFEDSPIGVALVGLDGRRFGVNEALCEMLGYSEEELLGEDYSEDIHPEDREASADLLRRTLEEELGSYILERRYVHADGHTVWNLTSVSLVRDSEGEPSHLVCLHQDVTERKEVETRLHKSEAGLAEAQRMAHLGSWEWNVKTGEVSWSDETFRIYGYEPEEFEPTLGKLMESVHPDDRELVSKKIDRALYEGEPYDFEHRILRPDGEERTVHRQAEVVLDEEGEPLRMIGTILDITERKEAEEQLRESEERYRAVVEQSAEAIWLFDPDTKEILESNTAFQELLGYTAEELREITLYDFVAHSRENVDSAVRRLAKDTRGFFGTSEYRRKDGEVLDVEVSGTVIPYRGKEAMCGVARDLTERKQAEEALRESEERFRSLIQNATDMITIIEEDGTIRYDSPPVERVLGYRPEERVGKNAFDYIHPDDRGRVEGTFAEALDNPGRIRPAVEFRLRHKDGSWRRVETTRTNLLDDPAVKGVVANSRDITQRRQTEEALKESEERHRAVVEQSVEGIYLFDPDDGRVLETNGAFEELLGYTSEELLDMSVYDFIAHEREDVEHNVERDYREGQRRKGERKYRREDGSLVDVEVSAAVVPYRDQEAVCCLVHDITERKALEERLEHQAFHDSLTGLPNRTLFLDRLEHALARAGREGGPVAVLLLDLDGFKVVNDSLGHDAGNEVLSEIAGRLRNSVRPGDTVGRIFGDEFAVLLEPRSGMEEACRVAERIQESLHTPFVIDGQEAFVKASIGIALDETAQDEPREDRPKELLRHADLAMYEAKSKGKAEYEVYDPDMNTRAVERMDLEKDLHRAIEREELEVHYQPEVLLETGEIAGVEALVRWRHPDRGLLLPTQFIPYAEEAGLIDRIGLWVLKESCRQLKEWQERGLANQELPFSLCVNLSARQIQQPDLAEKVAGACPSGVFIAPAKWRLPGAPHAGTTLREPSTALR